MSLKHDKYTTNNKNIYSNQILFGPNNFFLQQNVLSFHTENILSYFSA